MASGASNALTGIVALLEGTAGATECKIAASRFRRVDDPVEDLRVAPSSRPLPFNVGMPRLASGPSERGDMTSGSTMRGEWRVELVIAYGARPHDELTLAQEILDDVTALVGVLEYEPNVDGTTYAGWVGCAVEDVAYDEVIGAGEAPPLLRLLIVTLAVTTHDARTT
jgi:hypothetical protein